ncbi:MAG: BON domain-containing protein, partial [Terracidiphilus sp.]
MNCSLLKKGIRPLVAWTGMAMLFAVVAIAQDAGAPAGQSQSQPAAQQGPRTDGQIEMDVVHALDASAALKNDLITAATIQSEVTLSGTVSTDASKQLAESIAAHVNGVTKVHNNLTVGNPGPDAQNPQPAPDAQEMPGPDQSQAQQQTAGLPPPGPAPDQGPDPAAVNQAPAPYPQQGGYPPQPRPQYRSPQYSQYPPQYPQAPPAPQYAPASGPVTLPAGTLLQLRTSEPVDSKRAKDGEPVQFMVIQDVTMGGALAIPRGAVVHGVISEHKNVGSGKMAGSSTLALTLTSLDLGGRNYPIASDQFKVKAPNKAGQTVGGALTGGVIGTIIGCAVRGPLGCAVGAGVGAAGGTAVGAASPGYRAWIPAEARV